MKASRSSAGGARRLASRDVTNGSEQDQEAELAKQAEALREQGMPIFRSVQEYIVGAGAADSADMTEQAVAGQVSEAMDQEMADVIAAVGKLVSLAGTARW